LQKKVENMFLMMWTGNMANYLILLKKGKQHYSMSNCTFSMCGPSFSKKQIIILLA
jgi:Na+-transporting NADH:ubiquinone oxidoreductase subunit NqrF